MAVRKPTIDELRQIAHEHGMRLTDEDLVSYHGLMDEAIASYRQVHEMTEPKPPVKYPRTTGHRPTADENPLNAWYWKCSTAHFRSNVESLTGDLVHERFGLAGLAAVLSRAWLAWCLSERGEFAEAAAAGAEAVAIAELSSQPWSLAAALFGIGGVYLRKGELDRAVAMFERGVRICESGDVPLWFHMIASCLGYAHALSGRLDRALPILEQAVEHAGAIQVSARSALGCPG